MPEAARARSSGEPGPVLERSRCRRCFPLCRWALPLGARPLPSLGTVAPPRARPGWLPMGRGRCALGEKAFSSDPRGCLGVPNPPAVAPPRARSVACTAAFVGYGPPPRVGRGAWKTPLPFLGLYRGPRLPPPRRGRIPPGRAGVSGRVFGGPAACVWARRVRVLLAGRVPKGGRDAEALPRPRRASASALRAASLARSRPRGVLQPGGKRLAAGTFRGRLALGGAFHWGRESRPGSDPGGRTEKDEGGFPSRLGCARGPRWRGRAVQRRGALEGFSEGLVPQEGGRPASRASRGRPVCLWRWDPRAFSRRPVRAPGAPLSSEADLASPGRARALRPRVPRLARLPPSPPPLPAAAVGPSSSPRDGGGVVASATARPRETGAFRRAGVAPSALPPTPGAGAGRRLRAKFALRGPRPAGAPPALAAGWRLAGVCAGPGSAREGGRTVEPCSSRRGRGRGGAARGPLSRGWGLGRRFLDGRGCRSSSSRGCRGTAPGLGGLRR